MAVNDQLDLLAEFMGVGEQVAAITNSVGGQLGWAVAAWVGGWWAAGCMHARVAIHGCRHRGGRTTQGCGRTRGLVSLTYQLQGNRGNK